MARAAVPSSRRATAAAGALPRDRAFAAVDPVPFEHVWAPLLRRARRRARQRTGRAAYEAFAATAHADLERVLLGRVADLATRTLYRTFAAARAAHGPGAYRAFVRTQHDGGLCTVLAEHPVLARLLATVVDHWVDAAAELMRRYVEDVPDLAELFGSGRPLGRVTRVDAGLSDPHGGGRQVAILYPTSGPPIVYKPRSLAFDAAYAGLVRWLAAAAPPHVPTPRALRVLDRATHGWMEYVTPAPCAGAAGRRRYYERAGAVLCLAHVLRGGDLHSGNVVAAGEHPVLVDLEVLCAPVPAEGARAAPRVERSVLDTGLLPEVYLAGGGTGHVEGGLASPDGSTLANGEQPGWAGVNTDDMCWGTRPYAAPTPANVPRVVRRRGDAAGEVPYTPNAAPARAVARGFRRTYAVLCARRGELLADGGPLAAFAGGSSRVLLRATSVYGVLLRRTAHPPLLRDEHARAAELDVLRRARDRAAEWPALRPALAAEVEAMQRADVPLFTVPAAGTDLHVPGQGVVVTGYAAMSGCDAVRRGVGALGGAHLRRQLHLVRIVFAADEHRRAATGAPCAPPCADASALGTQALGTAEFGPGAALDEACRVAALLRAVAVRRRSGAAVWHAYDVVGGGQRRVGPAGLGLESGQAGIALFFAALARVLRAEGRGPEADDAAAWAGAALRPVVDAARRPAGSDRRVKPGLGAGWGGVAYALAGVAHLTRDAEALAAARLAVRHLGLPRPRAADDVFLGAAGALLGALAVHEAAGDECALALAAAWGDLLIARPRWVRGTDDGFGHGRGGVAAALLRLAARTGDRQYAPPAVRAALAQASDTSPAPAGGEPNGRAPGLVDGWCRGRPGRGLALVAALATGEGEDEECAAWRSTLAVLAAACASDDRAPWTLCCGALGRIELLLAAAPVLGQPALVDDARALAGRVVAGARRRRSYASPPNAEALVPGLLRGLAGTGYTLLRTVMPEALCSPLLAGLPGGSW